MTVRFRRSSHGLTCSLVVAILLSSGAQAAAAEQQPSGTPEDWTAADIAVEKTECVGLLRDLDVDITYLPPIKQGACGLAQPVELRGFGSHTHVKVDPPATLDCQMVAQLSRWFASSVQPLATTWLKSEISVIHDVGSYYCRNGIGDFPKRRNEHAKGNAIDLSGFTTTAGATITVGQSWGPTLRGLLTSSMPRAGIPSPGATASTSALPTDPGLQAAQSGKGAAAIREARLAEAAKRGIVLPKPSTPEGIFLHAVHDSACDIFGTVLSPEANNDHNEHFHLDMAQRPGPSYCE